jgi:BMFP domain-containing protein YqiC
MSQASQEFEEIEKLLKDIGQKIEVLIQKAAKASGEVKVELEKKIKALKENQTTIEKELAIAKEKLKQYYDEAKEDVAPHLRESSSHFKEGFKHLLEGIITLIKK